jgi:L-iditol 2-dehydrogenase
LKKNMLAFVYTGNKEFALTSVPVPQAKSDNVICKIEACSICGTDMRTYTKGSSKIDTPRIIGHEIFAEIIHIGDDVEPAAAQFNTGQKIIIAPAIGCGHCYSCRRGFTNLCESLATIGFQYEGGFAEYMEIPIAAFRMGNVIPVSKKLRAEEVVLCEPVACTLNAQELLTIQAEDTITIFGAGFIGCMHAELAKLKGVKKIIMVEFSGFRARQAMEMIPGIILIYPDKDDVVAAIKKNTNSIGSEVIITACSVGQTHTQALEAAAPRGRISLFGGLPEPSTGFLSSNLIHYKELGVFGVHASTVAQNIKILKLVEQKKLNMEKYISKIYPLEKIEEAFISLQQEPLLKIIIEP